MSICSPPALAGLDNVMSNAKEVALCMHTDGVVQGYRVVPTSELPSGCGLGSGFSPAAVTECAVSVLRFLRQNCTREAGTYWLTRPSGGDELQLFDITSWPLDAAEAAGASSASESAADVAASVDRWTEVSGDCGELGGSGTTDADGTDHDGRADGGADGLSSASQTTSVAVSAGTAQPGLFAVPVAILCWRIAEQLTAPHECARRRRLLESCVALLDDGQHRQQMPMAAAAHEALADLRLHEAHTLLPLPAAAPAATLADDAPRSIFAAADLAAAELTVERETDQACAAIAEHRAAARSLLRGVGALRSVCRPGAAPARLVRMLAKLSRELASLAHRYLLVRRPGRAVAALHRAANVWAAISGPALAHGGHDPGSPAGSSSVSSSGGGDRSPERGTMLMLLADAYRLAARASETELREYTAELAAALRDDELVLPSWAAAVAGSSAALPGGSQPPFASIVQGGALPTTFATDAEANLKLCISHCLSALKLVPGAALRFARARLQEAYSELGRLYVRTSRSTKACRHYQQGIELFRSTADTRSAAAMCVAFSLALRSRLSGAAGTCPGLPSATLGMAAEGGATAPPDGAECEGVYSLTADSADLERCAAACVQAHELLGRQDVDPPLWRQAEAEHARTLLQHASLLDERGSAALVESTLSQQTACTMLHEASSRFLAAGEPTAAGDAQYRLALLECRRHLRSSPHGAGTGAGAGVGGPRDGLDLAREHFERALALLPADTHPADHLFVRLDLVKLHRRVRPHGKTAPETLANLCAALGHLLATHSAFSAFCFPLPPVAARPSQFPAAAAAAGSAGVAGKNNDGVGGAMVQEALMASARQLASPPSSRGVVSSAGSIAARAPHTAPAARENAGSHECALVAALWPVMELELHSVLKELIRLHGQAGQLAQAATFKHLYRLSLTQRELLGTGVLGAIHHEWDTRRPGADATLCVA